MAGPSAKYRTIHPPSPTTQEANPQNEEQPEPEPLEPLHKHLRPNHKENATLDKGDTDMSDSDPSDTSYTPSAHADTEQPDCRPNILSLYNLIDNAMDIQLPEASSQVNTDDRDLDPVRKPSWITDTVPGCEELFLAHHSHLLIMPSAEFKVFLNEFTDKSIDRAITCFQVGIHSSKALIGHFDSRRAQIMCNSILQMTKRGSMAMALIYEIPKFWINLTGLAHASNMNAIESTMTRVFCMQGALKFHYWLLDIIPAAIRRTSKPGHEPKTWIDRLTKDVRSSMHDRAGATFQSSKYLPDLDFHSEYKMTHQSFQFDDTTQLTSILSAMLRSWLQFPGDQEYLAQLSLLEILTANSPPSILFLDETWQMFQTPFTTVFHNDWHTRRSRSKLMKGLANLGKEFAAHPFNITGSLSHRKLQYLHELIHQWMDLNNISVEIVS